MDFIKKITTSPPSRSPAQKRKYESITDTIAKLSRNLSPNKSGPVLPHSNSNHDITNALGTETFNAPVKKANDLYERNDGKNTVETSTNHNTDADHTNTSPSTRPKVATPSPTSKLSTSITSIKSYFTNMVNDKKRRDPRVDRSRSSRRSPPPQTPRSTSSSSTSSGDVQSPRPRLSTRSSSSGYVPILPKPPGFRAREGDKYRPALTAAR